MTHPPLIVFTDLDGTLLDHDSYSFAAALPALASLKTLNAPVILASSKTAAEIAPLRRELGFADVPAIVENGAGLLAAGAEHVDAGQDYADIRAALSALPADLRAPYTGFGDMGANGIADTTGLPLAQAKLAGQRQYSEPGLWEGDDAGRDAFLAALAEQGIYGREGGRFLTLSKGRTKADQMHALMQSYGTPTPIALGDAPNDVEMLQTAKIGIIVANPHRPPLPRLAGETTGAIRRTTLPGPQGWNAAMLEVLSELGLDPK